MTNKKKAPMIVGAKGTRNMRPAQAGYAAYCCDRRGQQCLEEERIAHSNGDMNAVNRWRELKWNFWDLRDQFLSFLEADDTLVEHLQVAEEDTSEDYPPVFVDIVTYRYHVGPFEILRREFFSPDEYEDTKICQKRSGHNRIIKSPLMSLEACEQIYNCLWKESSRKEYTNENTERI